MADQFTIIKLKQALTESGCPICIIQQKSVDGFLEHFLYEYVNDPGFRDQMINSLGFCPGHISQLAAKEVKLYGNNIGVNIIYEHLSRVVCHHLIEWLKYKRDKIPLQHKNKTFSEGTSHKAASNHRLFQSDTCFVCQLEVITTERSIFALFSELDQKLDNIATLYDKSDGICLNHLQRGLTTHSKRFPNGTRLIVENTIQKLEQQQLRMREYSRKHDWNYRHEKITEEENAAWQKTLAFFTGFPPSAFNSSHSGLAHEP